MEMPSRKIAITLKEEEAVRNTVFRDWLVLCVIAILAMMLVAAPSRAEVTIVQNPSNDHW